MLPVSRVMSLKNNVNTDKTIDEYNSIYGEIINNNDYLIVNYNKNDHYKYFHSAAVVAGGFFGGDFIVDKKISNFYEDKPLDTYMIFNKKNQEYIGNFLIKRKDDKIMLAIALSIDKFPPYTNWGIVSRGVSKYIRVIRDYLLSHYPYDKSVYHISLVSAGPGGDESHFLSTLNESNIMHVFSKGSMYDWDYCFD